MLFTYRQETLFQIDQFSKFRTTGTTGKLGKYGKGGELRTDTNLSEALHVSAVVLNIFRQCKIKLTLKRILVKTLPPGILFMSGILSITNTS